MTKFNYGVLSAWALLLALCVAFWAGVGLLAVEFVRWING